MCNTLQSVYLSVCPFVCPSVCRFQSTSSHLILDTASRSHPCSCFCWSPHHWTRGNWWKLWHLRETSGDLGRKNSFPGSFRHTVRWRLDRNHVTLRKTAGARDPRSRKWRYLRALIQSVPGSIGTFHCLLRWRNPWQFCDYDWNTWKVRKKNAAEKMSLACHYGTSCHLTKPWLRSWNIISFKTAYKRNNCY